MCAYVKHIACSYCVNSVAPLFFVLLLTLSGSLYQLLSVNYWIMHQSWRFLLHTVHSLKHKFSPCPSNTMEDVILFVVLGTKVHSVTFSTRKELFLYLLWHFSIGLSNPRCKDHPVLKRSCISASPQEAVEACPVLSQFPEGFLGKLQIRKSGKVELKLGDIVMDVSEGAAFSFLQVLLVSVCVIL